MEFLSTTLPPQDLGSPVRGIYMIRNSVSGKCYIGSSVDVIRRLRAHLSKLRRGVHHSHRFQAAWNKHGEAHFRFSIIEIVPHDIDILSREDVAFARFRPAYNVSTYSAANPMLGRRHTPESIALMSERKKGVSVFPNGRPPYSAEHRAKIGAARRGKPNPSAKRPRTAEEKANLSAKAKARLSGRPASNSRARAVEIDGFIYPTGVEAAIALGVSHSSIIRYIARGRGRYLDGLPANTRKASSKTTFRNTEVYRS